MADGVSRLAEYLRVVGNAKATQRQTAPVIRLANQPKDAFGLADSTAGTVLEAVWYWDGTYHWDGTKHWAGEPLP